MDSCSYFARIRTRNLTESCTPHTHIQYIRTAILTKKKHFLTWNVAKKQTTFCLFFLSFRAIIRTQGERIGTNRIYGNPVKRYRSWFNRSTIMFHGVTVCKPSMPLSQKAFSRAGLNPDIIDVFGVDDRHGNPDVLLKFQNRMWGHVYPASWNI